MNRLEMAVRIVAVVVGVAIASSAPAADLIDTPSVEGVTLGSTLSVVTQKLGKPKKTVMLGKDSELGMGELRELRFKGVTILVSRQSADREFSVYELRLTGATRSFSNGLRVGLRKDDVNTQIGEAEGSETGKNGDETLVYLLKDRDGRLLVRVHRGKVSCIRLIEENS